MTKLDKSPTHTAVFKFMYKILFSWMFYTRDVQMTMADDDDDPKFALKMSD